MKTDSANKIIFSVPDARFQRTGTVSGFGFPELLCDDHHAHVLLPFMDAAMRKVPKSNPDRDEIKPMFLRLVKFCRLMLTATSPSQEELVQGVHTEDGRRLGPDMFELFHYCAVYGCRF